MKKVKIFALVTDAYGGNGGIALYNRDFLESLCSHPKISTVIAVARCADGEKPDYPDGLVYDISGVKSSLHYIKAVILQLIRQQKFDMILCCHINLIPLAWLISKIYRIPIVLEIYGIEAWQPTDRWLSNYLSSSVHCVISISEFTKQRFLSWSSLAPEKCEILPNAIRIEDYGIAKKSRSLIERYGIENKKCLMTFGRIVSRERAKGFDEILDILPTLIQKYPDIMYIIAGDGSYKKTLIDKVKDLNLSNYVVFTGKVNESEKADIYRLADVFVMPGRGEGFGFVFLEAMACGIPVIASTIDGSREAVLHGELGEIVDPDNPKQIESAIINSLNKEIQIPLGLDFFSFDNFTKKLHHIMDNVLFKK